MYRRGLRDSPTGQQQRRTPRGSTDTPWPVPQIGADGTRQNVNLNSNSKLKYSFKVHVNKFQQFCKSKFPLPVPKPFNPQFER